MLIKLYVVRPIYNTVMFSLTQQMVLDAGRIVEFDSPRELLKLEEGKLRSLVDESGDRDNLFAMAEGNATSSH